ncbi:signal transduction histidine-protein kinase/phosphatase DegS [Peptococcaceae bacterium CEB3]|nr:signal transduction histidine-protein kinase/phosphatase DegS [Peptococcaceae bacterium CEB3]
MRKVLSGRPPYYLASAVFLLISVIYLGVMLDRAYVGLELADVNGRWIVVGSDPNGAAYKAGVRVGDRILEINQKDPGAYGDVRTWNEAEGITTLKFRGPGQSGGRVVKVQQGAVRLESLSEIFMIILGYLFANLGLLAWLRRPLWGPARLLFWLNWSIALALVLAPASGRDLLFAREFEYITLSFVPVLMTKFFSVFPVERETRINRYAGRVLICVSIAIVTLTVLQSAGVLQAAAWLRKFALATVLTGILISLGNLAAIRRLPGRTPEKNQAGILLLGTVIGFLPFTLLTALPLMCNFPPIENTELSYLFVAAVPITWSYVIVKRYLPDSRRLMRRVCSFSLAVAVVSFVLTYAFFFAGVLKSLDLEGFLAVFSLTTVVSLSFTGVRLTFAELFKRLGFLAVEQEGVDQRVSQLNERLVSLREEEDRILEEVATSLGVEGALLIVENADGRGLKKAVGRFLARPDEQTMLERYFQTDKRGQLGTTRLPEDWPAEICIRVAGKDFVSGTFLGHRYSRIKFQGQELPSLTLICGQTVRQLSSAQAIEELSQEIRNMVQRSEIYERKIRRLRGITGSLFKNVEQERKTIARDLHDGPLQLALDLSRWLDELADHFADGEESCHGKAIAHMREVSQNLNFELRTICSDLRPPSLTDLGLVYSVRILCEEKMESEPFEFSLDCVGISEKTRLREEVELVAYRFLQEGIANAMRHTGSGKINLGIELKESELELVVRDSGKGFDPVRIDDLPLTNEHLGLVGMRERIESLGGKLHICSVPCQGTVLKACIPTSGRERKRVV